MVYVWDTSLMIYGMYGILILCMGYSPGPQLPSLAPLGLPSLLVPMDPWIYGSMDPWAHGSMDPRIHESMGYMGNYRGPIQVRTPRPRSGIREWGRIGGWCGGKDPRLPKKTRVPSTPSWCMKWNVWRKGPPSSEEDQGPVHTVGTCALG